MNEYDEICLEYFLKHQLQLFDERSGGISGRLHGGDMWEYP